MPLERNELETKRFGVVAAHLVDTDAGTEEIDDRAAVLGVEMLTARVHVDALRTVHRLEDAGFRLMDTLVVYGRALADPPTAPARAAGTSIRVAHDDDAASVGAIAADAFTNYVGHFHADPLLDDTAYVEWAESSVAANSADRPVLVACEDEDVLGFLTLQGVGEPTAEIVLNAVDPRHQGRGLYAALVHGAMTLATRAGTDKLVVSTQINNYAVQRVWSRLGFAHERSVYTLHRWFDRTG